MSHGLQGDEFNFGAHYRSPGGELFFGGPSGFNAFFPERLPVHSDPAPGGPHGPSQVQPAGERPGPASGGCSRSQLDHRDSVVSFDFGVLDYAAPERNQVRLQARRASTATGSSLGSVRRVTFTNLDPGDYVLRVRAANNDGVWSSEGLALPLDVDAPALATRLGLRRLRPRLRRGGRGPRAAAAAQGAAREAEYRRRLEEEVQARTEEVAGGTGELEQLNAQLVETSLTDSLTGLRNRRYVFEQVSQEMRSVQRQHRAVRAGVHHDADQLIVLMVDLDWFKPINDTCGHAAGDRVLVQVRDVLREGLPRHRRPRSAGAATSSWWSGAPPTSRGWRSCPSGSGP